jgi:hypothetical protein
MTVLRIILLLAVAAEVLLSMFISNKITFRLRSLEQAMELVF